MSNLQPTFLIVAGPNGSGKTTFASQLQQHSWARDAVNINADTLAQKLGDWNDERYTRQAQAMAVELLNSAMQKGENILYETVFSHYSKVELIKRALSLGYFIRLFFICTETPRINIDRVAERFARGGHSVPGDKVTSRYNRSLVYGAEAMQLVQRGYLYDNSTPANQQGDSFHLILRTINGDSFKLYKSRETLPLTYAYFLRDFLGNTDYPLLHAIPVTHRQG